MHMRDIYIAGIRMIIHNNLIGIGSKYKKEKNNHIITNIEKKLRILYIHKIAKILIVCNIKY